MDPLQRAAHVVHWIAGALAAAFGLVTLEHFEAVVRISVGGATIAMCVAAIRLSVLRHRLLEKQLKDDGEV